MLRAAKDAVAAKIAQRFLNERFARYGRIEGLTIDSRAQTLSAYCVLQGETRPVSLAARYSLEIAGAHRTLRLAECRCSRPWLENLLADHVEAKPLRLPAWVAQALS